MPKNTTWVVVANNAHAKIFQVVRFPKIEEIAVLDHPASRLHDQDLVSSPPGTTPGATANRSGSPRSAYQPPTDPKRREFELFAKSIGDYLCAARRKEQFSRLYLIASPLSLGLIRATLDNKLQQSIIAEIPKDVVEHQKADIERYLAEL